MSMLLVLLSYLVQLLTYLLVGEIRGNRHHIITTMHAAA